MTTMEMISELYMMNRFQCITFNVLLLYLFFSEKKIPKQIFARVLWTCLSSFTSWLKILTEVCRISLDDVKAWKRSLPCHSPLLSNSTYSGIFYVMGIKGWEVSLFLVVMGFNKYYHCNIRLQSHQNFNKHYSFFCLMKQLGKKTKNCHLKIFFAFSCKWKRLLKKFIYEKFSHT